ncbi:MAG: TRAP transporter large permease subunit [Dehalococcoidales bacterium]|nr:TRAP transporter large permease subunit [Dehalococcoidales bacterium]
MSPQLIGWIGIIILFAVIATGIPLGLAMGLVGFVGFALITGLPAAFTQLATVPYASVASYTLTVLPLFILMGEFAFHSGLIRGAFESAHKFLGSLRGGLAMATIVACAGFAAVCGSGVACASTMTSVAYPEMKRFNYKPHLALGSIASGGTLGVLIPPSNPLVIYALFAEVSIGKLFMSGVLPGIILGILFVLTIFIWTKVNREAGPSGGKFSWIEKFISLKKSWPVIFLAVVIMGGLWTGIFTATEAAGIGAFAAFIIGLSMKNLKTKNVISSLDVTVRTSAMIFTILIGAMIFNYFIVMTGMPAQLATFVENLQIPAVGILIVILSVYFFLGCIMDTLAMTVLTLPIFLPIIHNLGFDLIWFGIIFIVMCEMAMITPPMGMNVFVIAGMARDVPMYTIYKGIGPFIIALVILLAVLISFPQIALFIPQMMSR